MHGTSIISALASGLMAGSALATVTGNRVYGDSYLVFDGARTYSVLDVYLRASNANDVVASVYGSNGFTASWTQQQGRAFKHAGGSSWNPSYTGTAGAAWDSFVTCGMREQQLDGDGSTPIRLTADMGFANFDASNAATITGNPSFFGAGWYPAAGANPTLNAYSRVGFHNGQSGQVNRAKGTGNGFYGFTLGQSLDNHFMIGRFTIDVTGEAANAVLAMRFAFSTTVKNAGETDTRGGATDTNYRVSGQELQFAVPSPAALALAGLAGLVARRRR